MATIANLAVSLTAKTGAFEAGMKKAHRSVSGFTGGFSVMNFSLAGIATKLAAIAGVASFGAMVKNSMDAIDATAKLSDELGIATERLIGYQYAAKLTGTDEATLNKGLQILVRRLGEAKQGYGEGVKALEAMGFSAVDFAKKNPADALEEIAQKIQGMPDAASRAATAYSMFGRQGQELMNFLLLGADGIAATTREAEKLGLTVSRTDAAKVELMNDAFMKVYAVVEGLVNKLVIELAPYVTWIAESFVDWATQGDGAVRTIIDSMQPLLMTFAKLIDWSQLLRAAWNLLGTVGASIGFVISKGWAVAISTVAKFIDTITFGLMDIQGKTAETVRFLDEMAKDYDKEMITNYAGFEDAMGSWWDNRSQSVLEEMTARARDIEATAKKFNKGPVIDEEAFGNRGKKKEAQFKSINLRRFALEGPGGLAGAANRKQEVTDREGNAILKQILSKIGAGGSVVPVYAGG